jgi:hypothetical protein
MTGRWARAGGGRSLRWLVATLLVAPLAGCAGQGGAGSQPGGTGASGAAQPGGKRAGTTAPAHHRAPRRSRSRGRGRPLAYSRAPDLAIQAQPAPGSCHATGSGLYSRPDPNCTPGALNPEVRQSDIDQTICVTGWTSTVRPPESITEPEKRASLAAYGDTGPLSDYEYDHLVPLELGGATNDPRNLWPEPGASPNPKDAVELDLRNRVCSGQITLAQAQREIAADWVKLAGATGDGRMAPGSGAACSVHAVFNPSYDDYDVYVHSNQPGQPVTVSAGGRLRSWHTDPDGKADVYFPGGRAAAGEQIDVRVGGAHCSGTL